MLFNERFHKYFTEDLKARIEAVRGYDEIVITSTLLGTSKIVRRLDWTKEKQPIIIDPDGRGFYVEGSGWHGAAVYTITRLVSV